MAKGWRRSKKLNEERTIFAFMSFSETSCPEK